MGSKAGLDVSEKRIIFRSAGDRAPKCPAGSMVTIPTETAGLPAVILVLAAIKK